MISKIKQIFDFALDAENCGLGFAAIKLAAVMAMTVGLTFLLMPYAFLEQHWRTAITGLALALFLTIEPKVVKEKTKLSYWIVLTSLIVLFLFGSIWDIRFST